MINKLSKFIICAAAFTALLPTSSFANKVECSISQNAEYQNGTQQCMTPNLAVPPKKFVIFQAMFIQSSNYLTLSGTVGVKNQVKGNILWTKNISADEEYYFTPINSKRHLRAYIKDAGGARGIMSVRLKYADYPF